MNKAIKVYVLEHVYELPDGEEEVKHIGIFSTEKNAQDVISQLKDKIGFNRYPIECFKISLAEIDRVGWGDGFITWDEANENESK